MQVPRIGCGLAAIRRGVLRDQRLCPIRIRNTAFRRFLQDPDEIAARIKMVFLCRLNQAEQDCAALGPICGIGEQEVFAGDYKGLNAALRAVIAELNAAVMQIGSKRHDPVVSFAVHIHVCILTTAF